MNSEEKDKIIFIFDELRKIHEVLGNQYQVNAYKNAIKQFKTSNQPHVGKKLKVKIDEILKTGKLQELEDLKRNPDIVALQNLNKIKGFGSKYINYIVKHFKARNINDVKKLVKDKKIKINDQQRIGIKYYHDLNQKIPLKEAQYITSCLEKIAKLFIKKDIKMTLVGSFKRGKKESKDVDIVMISKSDDPNLLIDLREYLLNNNVFHDCFVSGETRFSCLIKTTKSPFARQVDILYVPHEDYYTALLHFSSGEVFNRKIRIIAKKKGMKLSERGLFKGNKKIPIKSERDVFKHLGIPYVPVEKRD
jgi:DNA polymerase/3'-5' exonuclease PolX